MTDPALLPVGSLQVFERAGVERTFKRVIGGWNEVDRLAYGGRMLDDVAMGEEGWVYLRPAS